MSLWSEPDTSVTTVNPEERLGMNVKGAQGLLGGGHPFRSLQKWKMSQKLPSLQASSYTELSKCFAPLCGYKLRYFRSLVKVHKN